MRSFYSKIFQLRQELHDVRVRVLSADGDFPVANPAYIGLKVQRVHLVLRCGSGLCNASWPNLLLGCHVYVGKLIQ